jgi:hypothetical protein
MTGRSDTERFLDAFLASERADQLPDRVLEAALSDIARTPQRRALRVPWRFTNMPVMYRAAAAAVALVVLAGAGGVIYLNSVAPLVGGPNATATMSPTPSPSLSTPSSSPEPLDTTGWIPYTSERYGSQLAYPPGWTVVPADHTWTWDGDATNPLSTAEDVFISLDASVRVSVWTVPLATAIDESWPANEAWAIDYCTRSGHADCADIHARVVPMCIERRDCHAGVIVAFDDRVEFFGHGGVLGTGMTIVSLRPLHAAAVASLGGPQRLLEGFLSTMGVLRPFYPESQAAAAEFLASGATAWTTYTSAIYGTRLGYPSDWSVRAPATRNWQAGDAFPADELPYADTFVSPGEKDAQIGLAVWQMHIDVFTGTADLNHLTGKFCAQVVASGCETFTQRAIPLDFNNGNHGGCAILVPTADQQYAFLADRNDCLITEATSWITVVVVNQRDDFPPAARYGGSVGLLKSVVTTMNVWRPGQQPGA